MTLARNLRLRLSGSDLFNLANRVTFDDRINHEAEISDLNITLMLGSKEFLETL